MCRVPRRAVRHAASSILVHFVPSALSSGRACHVEAAALSSQFRTYTPAGLHAYALGTGGSVNAVLEVARNFRLTLTSFYNSGGGRYILGLAPDLTVSTNGSISLVHSMSGIGGFEYQITPASLVYGYYGGVYAMRNYSVVSAGSCLGFGFPGSSSAANRFIQEPIFGYVRTFWKSPSYGALQFITQYSYLVRAPWYVPAGTPENAHTHMVFADLRFVLP